MAKITQKNTTEPTTPSAGTTAIYTDSASKKLATKNDAGLVTSYASEGQAELAKVSANDTTANYLESKIVAGSNVTITTLNDGANETLSIAAEGGGSFEPIHPMNRIEWIDHFMSRTVSNVLNWAVLTGGTSQVLSNQNKSSWPFLSATDHFGTINMNLNGSGGRCIYYLTLSNEPTLNLGNNRKWVQEWRVYIDSLATESADYVMNAGWHGGSNVDDSTNGIYLQYKRSISSNWQLVTKLGATETRSDTGIAAATGWNVIGIEIAANLETVKAIINESDFTQTSPTLSTDGIESDYGVMFAVRQADDTNQKLFALDYFYMRAEIES